MNYCIYQSKQKALNEVAKHSTEKDYWIYANGNLYDITQYLSKHPGGRFALINKAGKDASEDFNFHSKLGQQKWQPFKVGHVKSHDKCVVL